jgi:signal transduction histidine kinase/serine phosphatase RsbU (regulator of sigma subunit)
MIKKKYILTLLLLLMLAAVPFCTSGDSPKSKPYAVNGILDLRGWDFIKDGPVDLRGEWKFRWMDDSSGFSDPEFDDSKWEVLKVPGGWNYKTGTAYGYGWARLTVLIDPYQAEFLSSALSIEQTGEIFSAYQLFVNGNSLMSAGKTGYTEAGEVPEHKPAIEPLPLNTGQSVLKMAVKMSNQNFIYGGFHTAPRIGLSSSLLSDYNRTNAFNYITFGILVMMILYHLFLWLARREDMASLFFAGICIALMCRSVYLTNITALMFPEIDSFNIHNKFSFISLPLAIFFLSTFYASLFPDEFYKKIVFICQSVGVAGFIIIAVTSVRIFSKLMVFFEIFIFLELVWIIVSIVRAFIRKKGEAWIILLGMILFFIAVTNDLFFAFGLINTGFYSQAGFITLIFAQSTALSLRFARTYRIADHLSKNLQEEVDIKTRDLSIRTTEAEEAKKEIEIANEKLREMDNYKNIFFQNITHEFRTPLTIIIGYIENVLEITDFDRQPTLRKKYQVVLSNAYRLLRLINQLLDLSKIDANMMRLKESHCDIVKLLRSITISFEPAAKKKRIEYDAVFDTDSAVVLCDREKIELIFYNLLSNAFKFTGSYGSVHIAVSTSGGRIIVSVKDTGPGIEENMIQKVFERFYQADSTTTRKHEGTGIGLSIVREYVDMHNGEIEVRSVKGEGSEFIVTLPLREADNHAADEGLADSSTSSETASLYLNDAGGNFYEDETEYIDSPGLQKPVILAVDDNQDIRNYIKDILSINYTVIEAENGIEALTKVRKHKPTLIISDIMMPEMDGYQFLSELKRNKLTSRIPVILLTAKSGESEKIEGLDAGADDYLAKPFSSRELLARTRSLIRLYRYQKIISERNREIEAELDIAREIQSKLILEDYRTKNRDNFHVVFYPYDKVAGDFYNYYEDDETVKIFMADVSGHGVAAAFLSLITKNELINTMGKYSDAKPVLVNLNSIINQYSVKCNFVTAFYCIFNKNTYRLTYCRAGHNPPLLVKKNDGSITELTTMGRSLGFFPDINIEERETPLEKGDRIIFYTDGLIENRDSSGNMFDLELLMDFIKNNPSLSPAGFCDRLMREVTDFTGSMEYDDDVTLIVFDIP